MCIMQRRQRRVDLFVAETRHDGRCRAVAHVGGKFVMYVSGKTGGKGSDQSSVEGFYKGLNSHIVSLLTSYNYRNIVWFCSRAALNYYYSFRRRRTLSMII